MSAHASARPMATASPPRQDAAPPPATRPRGAWRPGRDTLLALGAMLIAGLGMTLVQYAVLRDRLADELRTQATILAQTAQAAMLFGDAAESHELLGPLRAHRAIRSARLLDPAGRALARLDPPDAEARWDEGLPSVPPADVPIVANGRTIGTVQLAARMAPLWRELATFAAATAAVMAAALCLAAWGSRGLRADVRAAEQRQRYLAAHDALTGLANRATFNALLARATEPGTDAAEFALVFIDVDDFKRVNDTYGHGAGDALLQAVARRLRGHAGASDLVARLGGDEFAMVLRESPSPGAVRQLAGRILVDLAEPIDYQGDRISASASIGIALYPRDADGTAALLQAADTAMYHAKRLGKNSCEFYTTQIASGRAAQRALEEDLRIAIDGPELWLAYQPVYDSGDRIVSFEALLRWTHPRRGLVAPGDFVMLAEAAGLMPSLGLAILRIAARDIAAWRGHGLVVPRIAINLSSRQFPRDRHRAAFVEALDRHRLGPRDVSFELTESAVFEDMQSPQSVIAGLQARGYALALDDFGTGYSSLAYLLKLRCQSLKLDRAFVDGVSGSKESALLVSAIVQLAHGLGMQVIAEGVEQPADLAQVRRLGCDGVQGYLLARPMPAGAAARLLRPALERTPVA